MAKELPYFKFFCSEWTDGDITLEDYRVQGLFINICSYYWSNNCDVSLIKLKKKFKQESETIDYLIKENLIKINNDDVVITFLDEQLNERLETSKIKSKGGKASARARKLKKSQQDNNTNLTENEHVLNFCSTESQLLREDKIREDKIREDNIDYDKFLEWFNATRTKYLEIPSNVNRLTQIDKSNYYKLKQSYNSNDFNVALLNICNDKWANESNQILPSHFLKEDNFVKYLNMERKPLLTKKQKKLRGWEI